MTSPNQLSANKANAQLSTGPRTSEGKATSAQNARTHGLRSVQAIVHPDELDEYHAMRDGLLAEICPEGALQMIFFEQLLHAAWNQRRCRLLEADLDLSAPDENRIKLIERYLRRAQQSFNRALAEIRKMQTEQAYRQAAAQDAEEPLPSKGLTDTAAVRRLLRAARRARTERTQSEPSLDQLEAQMTAKAAAPPAANPSATPQTSRAAA